MYFSLQNWTINIDPSLDDINIYYTSKIFFFLSIQLINQTLVNRYFNKHFYIYFKQIELFLHHYFFFYTNVCMNKYIDNYYIIMPI
jgi:hypothetical protein